jgi:hypothetical protein
MNVITRGLRFIISIALLAVSFYFLSGYINAILNKGVRSFTIDGFLSIWSMFGLLFLGGAALVMSIVTRGSWRESKYNKMYVTSVLVSAAVISPLCAVIVSYQLHAKTSGFIECKDLKQSSRRHSSKTYAITPLECQRLVNEKQARQR